MIWQEDLDRIALLQLKHETFALLEDARSGFKSPQRSQWRNCKRERNKPGSCWMQSSAASHAPAEQGVMVEVRREAF